MIRASRLAQNLSREATDLQTYLTDYPRGAARARA